MDPSARALTAGEPSLSVMRGAGVARMAARGIV